MICWITQKIKLMHRQINNLGFVDGIKSFAYICLQKKLGRRIYSVRNKKTGKGRLYLRSCSTDDYVANSILKKGGGYDFLPQLMGDSSKIMNVIDGGSNIGIFSRMIYRLNKNAKIVAVELEESNYEMTLKNTEGLPIKCLHGGIWNKNAKLSISGHYDGNEAGFMAYEADDKIDSTVWGYTIDKVMEMYKMDSVDILKLDIEGAEIEVFDDSCEAWIDRVKVVIIELHDRYRMGCSVSVFTRMQEHGFNCTNWGRMSFFIGIKVI